MRLIIPIILISLCLSACSLGGGGVDTLSGSTLSKSKYSSGISESDKVALALERKKELRTIRKGDYMLLKNNPESAVQFYTEALEKLPNDIVIARKLAHAYFLLKKWPFAYTTYTRVPMTELSESEQGELFSALFFDDNRPDRLAELARYSLSGETQDYYQIVDTCYTGIHNCIVSIEAYSGVSTKVTELKNTIKQSTNVSPDYQYRNFLVAALFYKQKMYRAVSLLTKEILEKQPNYTEVLKLRGFALYELGQYSDAKTLLLSYLEQKPKDVETIIRLGEISAQMGDYATSNLYLNNAITEGYQKKTEIERRLAYNYAALGDTKSMMQVLSYLLQESDVTEDDYSVAISLALKNGETTRAYAWAYSAVEKYPESNILIPLYLTTLRTSAQYPEAIAYVERLSESRKSNPFIQLEYAICLYEMGQLDRAQTIFQSIHDLDATTDWGIEASNYLTLIQTKRAEQASGSLQLF